MPLQDGERLLMTQAEYARHRGVGRSAVADYVKRQKIELVEKDGSKWVDAAAADLALGAARERVTLRDDPAPIASGEDMAPMRAPAEGAGLTKAKTATEVYRARLARLEYEKAIGQVVEAEGVHRATVTFAEVFVKILEMPLQRIEPLMAAAARGVSDYRAALRTLITEQRARSVAELQKLPAAVAEVQQSDDAD
jgi:hypothetical protein